MDLEVTTRQVSHKHMLTPGQQSLGSAHYMADTTIRVNASTNGSLVENKNVRSIFKRSREGKLKNLDGYSTSRDPTLTQSKISRNTSQ